MSREPELLETIARRCPHCRSENVPPVGRVIAAGRLLKEERRCAMCDTRFLFVWKPPVFRV